MRDAPREPASPEADDPATEMLRRMTPIERLEAAGALYQTARNLHRAALRARHPEANDAEIERLVREGVLYARD
jgi:hypothetical protein